MPRPPTATREEYARLVLNTIRDIRDEHHACTSREIGRRLQVPHQIINRQFDVLRIAGLVDATAMPGSIHLTARGGKVASGGPMPELQKPKKTVYKDRTSQDAIEELTPAPAADASVLEVTESFM